MPNRRMADARKTSLRQTPCGIIRIAALCDLCRYRHNVHWTGHGSRLARDQSGVRGGKAYAREELVAEMGAAFVCASLGIVPTVRHADYLGSWLEVLKEDNRAVFRAASQASKAADFLLAFRPDVASLVADPAPVAALGKGRDRELVA
uniref:Antirestriction protein-like protein n=1 Tax=Caulobacter sp. (strain K31) TaxID=366602 RepID=B0T6S2_CAUSK